jgi:tetratricopeptide (TPR) repeat protein
MADFAGSNGSPTVPESQESDDGEIASDTGYNSDTSSVFEDAVNEVVGADTLEEVEETKAEKTQEELENDNHEKDITKALEAKERGNGLFRTKDFDGSISEYSSAIAYCPNDEENKDNLGIFLGNRAAAYFAVEEYDQVIEDCSRSLQSKPDYVKVLIRRSQAYEKKEDYDKALEDARRVRELDAAYSKIADTVRRLEKLNDEKINKMKDEALGKLKDLGNSILGNFGMSLDNFKMTQDPNTGGWSIGMQNK